MNDKAVPDGLHHLSFRVIDSALLIAIALAVLQYAGWTYLQAYLGRFGIDPSGLNSSGMAVAAEGLGAIITTTLAWAAASAGLIATAIGKPLFIHWIEREGEIAALSRIRPPSG